MRDKTECRWIEIEIWAVCLYTASKAPKIYGLWKTFAPYWVHWWRISCEKCSQSLCVCVLFCCAQIDTNIKEKILINCLQSQWLSWYLIKLGGMFGNCCHFRNLYTGPFSRIVFVCVYVCEIQLKYPKTSSDSKWSDSYRILRFSNCSTASWKCVTKDNTHTENSTKKKNPGKIDGLTSY